MENVTRYTCGAGDGMFESKEGYYVDYADYKILLDKYNQALRQHDVVGRSEQLPESDKLCRMNRNFVCNCIDDSRCPNF